MKFICTKADLIFFNPVINGNFTVNRNLTYEVLLLFYIMANFCHLAYSQLYNYLLSLLLSFLFFENLN